MGSRPGRKKKLDEISTQVFKAFHANKSSLIPPEARDVWLCDLLNLSYTELSQQPAAWVHTYVAYLDGKTKAELMEAKRSTKAKTPPFV